MNLIKINLLSKENIKKEEKTELILLALLVIIIAAIIGAFIYFSKLYTLKLIEDRINQVQNELAKYEPIVRQVEELESTKRNLETKKSVINMLRDNGIIYPRFMEDLMSVMPSGISLKTLSTVLQPDGKITVSISADAIGNYPIADFITQLTVKGYFSDIELGSISTSRTPDKGAISSFMLNFSYQNQRKK